MDDPPLVPCAVPNCKEDVCEGLCDWHYMQLSADHIRLLSKAKAKGADEYEQALTVCVFSLYGSKADDDEGSIADDY